MRSTRKDKERPCIKNVWGSSDHCSVKRVYEVSKHAHTYTIASQHKMLQIEDASRKGTEPNPNLGI